MSSTSFSASSAVSSGAPSDRDRKAALAKMTPHDLRDTAATLAFRAGATVKETSVMLGHSTPSVTLRIYTGVLDSMSEKTDDALDATFRAASATQKDGDGALVSIARWTRSRQRREPSAHAGGSFVCCLLRPRISAEPRTAASLRLFRGLADLRGNRSICKTGRLPATSLVGGRGFEPLTSSVSRKRSPPELTAPARQCYRRDSRRGPESNRCARLCRPLPNHSATPPKQSPGLDRAKPSLPVALEASGAHSGLHSGNGPAHDVSGVRLDRDLQDEADPRHRHGDHGVGVAASATGPRIRASAGPPPTAARTSRSGVSSPMRKTSRRQRRIPDATFQLHWPTVDTPEDPNDESNGLPLMTLGARFEGTIAAARAGDRRALEDLYVDLHPRVLRYLVLQARDGAEDLASETWLSVAAALPAFEGDENDFRAFVFTIARRRLLDGRRRDARHATVPFRSRSARSPRGTGRRGSRRF